jgi:hypothetical protein
MDNKSIAIDVDRNATLRIIFTSYPPKISFQVAPWEKAERGTIILLNNRYPQIKAILGEIILFSEIIGTVSQYFRSLAAVGNGVLDSVIPAPFKVM